MHLWRCVGGTTLFPPPSSSARCQRPPSFCEVLCDGAHLTPTLTTDAPARSSTQTSADLNHCTRSSLRIRMTLTHTCISAGQRTGRTTNPTTVSTRDGTPEGSRHPSVEEVNDCDGRRGTQELCRVVCTIQIRNQITMPMINFGLCT